MELYADCFEGFAVLLCAAVVFGEVLDVVFEGVEACGGKDTGLAHAAAEDFSEAACVVDGFGIANEAGADGGAESFGETDADGVAVLCVVLGGDAGGDGGVEETGTVAVEF